MKIIIMLCVAAMMVVPYLLFKDTLGTGWFIAIFAAEIAILWGVLFLLRKKKVKKGLPALTLEEQEEEYQELFAEYHIPDEYIEIIIMKNTLYSLCRCPAIAWKVSNVIHILPLKEPTHTIRRPCEWFLKPMEKEESPLSTPLEDDWDEQDDYTKQRFAHLDPDYMQGHYAEEKLRYLGKFALAPSSYEKLKKLIESPPPPREVERLPEEIRKSRYLQ